MEFLQVAKGLHNEQVDATFRQGCDLLTESIARFLQRGFTQWLNSNAKRADRTGDPNVEALGSFARQAGASEIDIVHPVRQGMPTQPKAIPPESIGFNDFRSHL